MLTYLTPHSVVAAYHSRGYYGNAAPVLIISKFYGPASPLVVIVQGGITT